MLMDDTHSLSNLGTPGSLAEHYNTRTKQNLTPYEIFDHAQAGEWAAREEVDTFLHQLAKSIFNLSYAIDPERIIIGGPLAQLDWLIPELKKRLQKMMELVGVEGFVPEIIASQFVK